MVPTVALPPATPSTVHVTLASAAPCTVGVNCWVWVKVIDAARGTSFTVTPGGGGGGGSMSGWLAPPPQPAANPTARHTNSEVTNLFCMAKSLTHQAGEWSMLREYTEA